jgi:hypothetical protein
MTDERFEVEEVSGEELRAALKAVARELGGELPEDVTEQRARLLSQLITTCMLMMHEAVTVARQGPLRGWSASEGISLEQLRATGNRDVVTLLDGMEALSLVLARFTPRIELPMPMSC